MSGKTKVAYIGLVGVIAAAVITGVSLYLSNHNGKSDAVTATNNTVVNVAPASAPPTKPSFEPFEASVSGAMLVR